MLILSISCLVVLGVQIIYLIVLWAAISRKAKKELTGSQPPVSVIVCAHDEEENLRELVPLLLAQNYPDFEVIVVEDRCNDGTFDYLWQATKDHARLKMVRVKDKPEHINGKKFGLTLGIRAAKYDWLLFTDADCRPVSTQWISHMASQLADPATQLVLGVSPYRKLPGLLNSFIRFESLLTAILYIGFTRLGKPYMGVGRNLLYAKSLFLRNKGFHTHQDITGGDDDLFVNMHATTRNTRVCVDAEAFMISQPKLTWSEFLKQKLRHLSVGKRYRFTDKLLLGIFTLTWVATWCVVLPFFAFSGWLYWIAGAFLLRWILFIGLFASGSKQLGGEIKVWKTPFLDFIFGFYYLVTALRALVVKRIRWKN